MSKNIFDYTLREIKDVCQNNICDDCRFCRKKKCIMVEMLKAETFPEFWDLGKLMLPENERNLAQGFYRIGANWMSYDGMVDVVGFWKDKPLKSNNGIYGIFSGGSIGTVNKYLFPSITSDMLIDLQSLFGKR